MINEINKINEKEMEIQSEEQAHEMIITNANLSAEKISFIDFRFESEKGFTFYVEFKDGYKGMYQVDKCDGRIRNK